MTRDRIERFFKNVLGALRHCVLEDPETVDPALVAITCVGALWIVGIITTIIYELMFDPYAANVAATLNSLSIDPDKWFPR